MPEPPIVKGAVAYRYLGIKHVGTYEVVGILMTLTCSFGVFKASAGRGDPRKFARALLKSVSRRAESSKATQTSAL